MQIVDAQGHIWERGKNTQRIGEDSHQDAMTADDLIAAMDTVGIDATLLVTKSSYGADNRFGLEGVARFPDRLALVGRVDLTNPDPDALFATWLEQSGMVGWRLTLASDREFDAIDAPAQRSFLAAAARHGVPLCIYAPGRLKRVGLLPRRYPDLQFVIDHLGIGRSEGHPVGDNPFDCIPDLLALATYPNVAVKATAVPAWSREGFPFRDIWPTLHLVLDAFGVDRVMWGTDFTAVGRTVPLAEAVKYVVATDELSANEKELLLGKTVRKVFSWNPSGHASVAKH